MRKLENWIESYVEYTKYSESPTVYRRWAAISTVAAAMKRKCWIQWDKVIYPNLFVVLVGPSGGRKSTAIYAAKKMLKTVGVNIAPDSITREAFIREMVEASESYMLDDGTVIQHASLTIFASELAVFLGTNNQNLITDLCDVYDTPEDWEYRSVGRGKDSVPGVFLNMIGCITPRLISMTLPQDAVGAGLVSRMLFIFAEGKERKVALPFSFGDEVLEEALTHDLDQIHATLKGKFSITQGFADVWTEWYLHSEPPIMCAQLEAYIERRASHLLKLCMIVSAAHGDTRVITEDHFNEALGYLKEAENSMSKTFSGYGRSELAEVLPLIMRDISMKGEISFKELYRKYITELKIDQMEDVLRSLESIGFCSITFKGSVRYIIANDAKLKGDQP